MQSKFNGYFPELPRLAIRLPNFSEGMFADCWSCIFTAWMAIHHTQ